MKTMCFVVLHYITFDDTANCVDSILALDRPEQVQVVVVDNGSGNASGEALQNRYRSEPRVTVLINEENLGFARGHNVGYAYAREVLRSDVIAVVNNDIVIRQHDFVPQSMEALEQGCDLLGPDITDPQGATHQNPQSPSRSYRRDLLKYRLIRLLFTATPFMNIDRVYTWLLTHVIRNDKHRQKDGNKELQAVPRRQSNVQLHGAFIIYGSLFVSKQRLAFYPGTFLYLEEDFLYRFCKRNGYTTRYDPSIQVIHTGSSSTKAANNTTRTQKIARMNFQIASTQLYLESE